MNYINFKLSVVWGFWPKVYHWKSVFFGREKILKFGRKCPEPAGMVLNPFWTPQQKHLTPFHKKLCSVHRFWKKYHRPKGGYFRTSRYEKVLKVCLFENQKEDKKLDTHFNWSYLNLYIFKDRPYFTLSSNFSFYSSSRFPIILKHEQNASFWWLSSHCCNSTSKSCFKHKKMALSFLFFPWPP